MWIWLGLACALLTSTGDVLCKKLLAGSDERVVGWGQLLFTLPWAAGVMLQHGWPRVSIAFWITVAVMLPLEVTATLCYLKAIRICPMSLCIPFLAITPLLTVLTGWLFLGERVSWVGFMGVASVTVGAYVLKAEHAVRGLLEPFREMFRVPGIRLVLITATCYGVTSTLGKKAILLSSPTAFPFLYYVVNTLALSEIARRAVSPQGMFSAVRSQWWLFLLVGLVSAGSLFAFSFGIQHAPVAYFISVKRLSLLITVLFGGFLFGEEAFGRRAMGAALMLSGAVLITLGAR